MKAFFHLDDLWDTVKGESTIASRVAKSISSYDNGYRVKLLQDVKGSEEYSFKSTDNDAALITVKIKGILERVSSRNAQWYVTTAIKMGILPEIIDKRIRHQEVVRHSPAQNGCAEKENCTVVEKPCTMIIDADLPKMFRAEALSTATYLTNHTPLSSMVYVADFLVMYDSEVLKTEVKRKHIENFEMKDLGPVKNKCLGMKINQTEEEITMDLADNIQRIICKFNMNDCKPVSTPMETGLKMNESEEALPHNKRQCTVALSTTEAEYMVLSFTAQEALWLRELVRELDLDCESDCVTIFCDNKKATQLAKKSNEQLQK
ncbi:hypothetical protein PR048_003782 [Dryococelus australis]|uniref:Reverse transcriptase Ty1/copia-type domain-containing protein n=1 Tax=Dryococelus australis TaxID=614101 RepID=A0ABQ9IP15_9NEOP|nr:hypothetical protein PR048_003782 [Dryococelus australis]